MQLGTKVRFIAKGVGCTGWCGVVCGIDVQGDQLLRVRVDFGAEGVTGWWSADSVVPLDDKAIKAKRPDAPYPEPDGYRRGREVAEGLTIQEVWAVAGLNQQQSESCEQALIRDYADSESDDFKDELARGYWETIRHRKGVQP